MAATVALGLLLMLFCLNANAQDFSQDYSMSIGEDGLGIMVPDVAIRNFEQYIGIFQPTKKRIKRLKYSWHDSTSGTTLFSDSKAIKYADELVSVKLKVPDNISADTVRLNITSYIEKDTEKGAVQRSITLPVIPRPILVTVLLEHQWLQPGQSLNFRLFALPAYKAKLFNAPLSLDAIFVLDSNRRVMWRRTGVSGESALAGFKFNLPAFAPEGRWQVCGRSGSAESCRPVQVRSAEAVGIQLQLKLPKRLILNATEVDFAICVAPRPVRVAVKAKLCLRQGYLSSNIAIGCVTVQRTSADIRGCLSFREPTADLGLDNVTAENATAMKLHLSVMLIEKVTNISVIGVQKGSQLDLKPFRIVFDDPPKTYKPGLPCRIKVRLIGANERPPKAGTAIEIIAPSLPLAHGTVLRSDADGRISLNLAPFPEDIENVRILFRGVEQPKDARMVRPEVSLTIRPTMPSPTGSYMEVEMMKGEGAKRLLRFRTNTPVSEYTVKMVIVTRGNIRSLRVVGKNINQSPCDNMNATALGHYTCEKKKGNYYYIRCADGWHGDNCLTPYCSAGCVRGFCHRPDQCLCNEGWKGDACNICVQRPGCQKGVCQAGNDCVCLPGWIGSLCDSRNTSASDPTATPPKGVDKLPIPRQGERVERQKLTMFVRDETIEIEPSQDSLDRQMLFFVQDSDDETSFLTATYRLRNRPLETIPAQLAFNTSKAMPGAAVNVTLTGQPSGASCVMALETTEETLPAPVTAAGLASRLQKAYENERCAAVVAARSAGFGAFQAPPDFRPIPSWTPRRVMEPINEASNSWIFKTIPPSGYLIITAPPTEGILRAEAFCLHSKGLTLASSTEMRVQSDFTVHGSLPELVVIGWQKKIDLTLKITIRGKVTVRLTFSGSNGLKLIDRSSATYDFTNKPAFNHRVHLKAISPGTAQFNVTAILIDRRSGSKRTARLLLTTRITPKTRPLTKYSTHISCVKENRFVPHKEVFKFKNTTARSRLELSGELAGRQLGSLIKMAWKSGEDVEANLAALLVNTRLLLLERQRKKKGTSDAVSARRLSSLVRLGHSRLLRQQRKDGGYSARGDLDSAASTWTTAAAIWALLTPFPNSKPSQKAAERALQLLQQRQQSNGCFNESGRVLRFSLAGGSARRSMNDPAALTASVLLYLRSPLATNLTKQAVRCFSDLKPQALRFSGSHALALMAHALALTAPNSSAMGRLLAELALRQVNQLDMTHSYWLTGGPLLKRMPKWRLNMADVETTAHVALTRLEFVKAGRTNQMPQVVPIVTWLLSKQAKGRWFSAQDNAIALESVTQLEQVSRDMASGSKLKVTLNVVSKDPHERLEETITEKNRDIIFTKDITNAEKVYMSRSGKGCVLVRSVTQYYEA